MGRKKSHNLNFREQLNLNPEISNGLLAIFLFAVSGLSILSFFSMAGVAGQFIDSLLAICFGQVRYIFPVVLLLIAVLIIKDLDYDYRPTHFWGALLFFLSFNGLIHLKNDPIQMLEIALQGYSGGLIGLILAWPLNTYLGYWGGLVVLVALIAIALIIILNTSLAQIINLNKKAFLLLGWFGKQALNFANTFKQNKPTATVNNYVETEKEEDEAEDRPFEHRTISKIKTRE